MAIKLDAGTVQIMFEYMFSEGFSVDHRQFIAIHMKNIVQKVYGVSLSCKFPEFWILSRLQNGVSLGTNIQSLNFDTIETWVHSLWQAEPKAYKAKAGWGSWRRWGWPHKFNRLGRRPNVEVKSCKGTYGVLREEDSSATAGDYITDGQAICADRVA